MLPPLVFLRERKRKEIKRRQRQTQEEDGEGASSAALPNESESQNFEQPAAATVTPAANAATVASNPKKAASLQPPTSKAVPSFAVGGRLANRKRMGMNPGHGGGGSGGASLHNGGAAPFRPTLQTYLMLLGWLLFGLFVLKYYGPNGGSNEAAPSSTNIYGSHTGVVMCHITAPSRDLGEQLAEYLVELKLAACVNVVQTEIKSIYRWKGKIEKENEVLLEVKTTAKMATAKDNKLIQAVKKKHPYDVPEVICTPIVGGNSEYIAWVKENVAGG